MYFMYQRIKRQLQSNIVWIVQCAHCTVHVIYWIMHLVSFTPINADWFVDRMYLVSSETNHWMFRKRGLKILIKQLTCRLTLKGKLLNTQHVRWLKGTSLYVDMLYPLVVNRFKELFFYWKRVYWKVGPIL